MATTATVAAIVLPIYDIWRKNCACTSLQPSTCTRIFLYRCGSVCSFIQDLLQAPNILWCGPLPTPATILLPSFDSLRACHCLPSSVPPLLPNMALPGQDTLGSSWFHATVVHAHGWGDGNSLPRQGASSLGIPTRLPPTMDSVCLLAVTPTTYRTWGNSWTSPLPHYHLPPLSPHPSYTTPHASMGGNDGMTLRPYRTTAVACTVPPYRAVPRDRQTPNAWVATPAAYLAGTARSIVLALPCVLRPSADRASLMCLPAFSGIATFTS